VLSFTKQKILSLAIRRTGSIYGRTYVGRPREVTSLGKEAGESGRCKPGFSGKKDIIRAILAPPGSGKERLKSREGSHHVEHVFEKEKSF